MSKLTKDDAKTIAKLQLQLDTEGVAVFHDTVNAYFDMRRKRLENKKARTKKFGPKIAAVITNKKD